MFNDFEKGLFVQGRLHEHCSDIKQAGKTWRIRCPLCGDSQHNTKKKRGNYYLDTVSYYCFNCNQSESGLGLIAKIENKTYSEIQSEFIQEMISPNKKASTPTDYSKLAPMSFDTPAQKLSVDANWVDIPNDIGLIVTKRKLNSAPFLPHDWKLFYEPTHRKIVIPWMRDNEIKCYQYRKVFKNDTSPKYLFNPDVIKDVFNIEGVDTDFDFVFILEGVFDAIFVKNGVATGGLNISKHQLEVIAKYTKANVVYLPDNQWQDKSSLDFSLKLAEQDKLIFVWPKDITQKDVNSYFMETGSTNFSDPVWLTSHIKRGMVAKLFLSGKM